MSSLPDWVSENVCLKDMSSWRAGGSAQYFCHPSHPDELREALTWAHKNDVEVTVLGGGSNVLISDEGVPGLVIRTENLDDLDVHVENNELVIRCGAGLGKSKLLKVFLKEKLEPSLFLAGLPGDVGGGIVMNAGVSENVHPREFHSLVRSFKTMAFSEGQVRVFEYENQDIEWHYRGSKNWQGVIFEATLAWPIKVDETIIKKVREANKTRLQKQPLDEPSCGSVFKNPDGHKAAQLIDKAGLKGLRMGGAEVSEKHANFIVNKGDATAKNIHSLIVKVQQVVKEQFGVSLTNEVRYLGSWD